MTAEALLAFNLALLAALASPGPALLVAIRTSLAAGRGAGFTVGCGLGLVAALWTLAALLGLDAVFRAFPLAYWGAKVAGAAYLLFVAWGMWRAARTPLAANARPATQAFREGVLINLLNPKSVLFAAAVLAVIFPAGLDLAEKAAIAVNHLIVEIAFYGALSAAMTAPAVSRRYLSARLYIDRAAAVVLGALGLSLLAER